MPHLQNPLSVLLQNKFGEIYNVKRLDEIKNKYIKNPPKDMTDNDIRHMSEDDLLDMDYFLNKDDVFDDNFPASEDFYIF